MQIRLLRWGRGLLVVGLTLLGACDPRRQSVADEESGDAGADAVTAAPMCPYAPMPLGACEGFRSPEPACTVDIEGRTVLSQRTFDATGRRIGATSALGVSRVAYDEAGRVVLEEDADDGCVTERTSHRRLGDGWLSHHQSERVQTCSFIVYDGEAVVQRQHDPDCDCRDVITLFECELGPHGPVRCVERHDDGSLSGIWTFRYDAAGQRVGSRFDRDGDGVAEEEQAWIHDGEGRLVEERRVCAGCQVPRACWYFVYEEAPRRSTVQTDSGCDGVVDAFSRMTFDDEDRVVLDEHGTGDVVTGYSETVYDDRGGYRETWSEDGRVVRVDELVIEGARRTFTRTRMSDDGQRVFATVTGEHGGRIERVEIERDGRGELIELRHHHYSRDARGLVVGERVRKVTADGQSRACTVGYRWSGPCPVPPVDYAGEGCAVVEP